MPATKQVREGSAEDRLADAVRRVHNSYGGDMARYFMDVRGILERRTTTSRRRSIQPTGKVSHDSR